MNDELLTMIEREVKSWPGVTAGDTGRGGLQFNHGRVELGHLHGSSFADLPFPKKVRDDRSLNRRWPAPRRANLLQPFATRRQDQGS